ncbi:hypothetical protein YC2023_021260 [Brassica napus]
MMLLINCDGVGVVQWVRKMTDSNKESVVKVLDPRLSSFALHEVTHVFYVAMLCVEEQAVERPTIREVVQILTEVPKMPTSKDQPPENQLSQAHICIIESDSGCGCVHGLHKDYRRTNTTLHLLS